MTEPSLALFDVLDREEAGLRLQIELTPRANYSLVTSGIPFINAIAVHNETGRDLPSVRVDARLQVAGGDFVDWAHTIPGTLAAGSVTRLDAPAEFASFSPLLAQAAESTSAVLQLMARAGDTGAGPRIDAAIEISAYNEFLNFPELHRTIAAFVQPNERAVTPILRAASDLLLKRTNDGSLQGYQAGPQRAHRVAGALYEALRAQRVTYVTPPASFERTGQKVRTTAQVLADRFGTCIDLAVLYAACLEAAGLFPVIFMTRRHAFAAFWLEENYPDQVTVTETNSIVNLIETGAIVPVELTGIGPGETTRDFEAARKTAQEHFRQGLYELRTMVDITAARISGVRPMARHVVDQAAPDDAALPEQVLAERPFVARSSLRNLDAAIEEEHVRGVLERVDESPQRFRSWKRDLLDLSLRNPLLNMPRTSKVLDLVVPDGLLPAVDDVIHAGKSIRLAAGVGDDAIRSAIPAGDRLADNEAVPPSVARTLFSAQRMLVSSLEHERHRARLRAMKREAETLEQESGSNFLYLTIGTLVHPKPGGEARAPLFLLPVKIRGGLGFTPYSIVLDGDDIAQPNLCLLQWLDVTKGLQLDELAHPAVDDNGLAVETVLAGIRQRLVDAKLPYRVDETVSLAILKFSTFQIWKDLDTNWRQLMASPVIEHLVERPGETFADPVPEAPALDERAMLLPIAADGSQMAAIARATSGQSFVLEGPPGTGKSQTITNLIAHALGAGKKVLFVAEKQAALEVVRQRLDAVGLGSFALELHGNKQSMNTIREQLRSSIALRPTSDAVAWSAASDRRETAIAELARYPERVHGTNASGHSLWSAFDALGTLGDGPSATIPEEWVASRGGDVRPLVAAFADAAIRFGLQPRHPWALSGRAAAADFDAVLEASVRAALVELAQALGGVGRLPEASRPVLAELRPDGRLAAAVELLDARSAGLLPSPAHAIYIDRQSWRDSVDALRARIAGHREQHAAAAAAVRLDEVPAAELPGWIEASTKLDGQWFFPELRRGSIVKALRAFARDGVELPRGEAFTALLRAISAALADADVVRGEADLINGLLLPRSWHAYDADAVGVLDAATRVARTAAAFAGSAPLASAALADLDELGEAVIRDVAGVWERWAAILSISAETLAAWVPDGDDWVARWIAAQPEWAADVERAGILQLQRFGPVRAAADAVRDAGLPAFAVQLAGAIVPPSLAGDALQRGVASASLVERSAAAGLVYFDADAQDAVADSYLQQSSAVRELLTAELPAALLRRRPFSADDLRGEVAELKRQVDRKRGGLSFRELAKRYPDALTSITPCFLMSPGSVAHYLDPDAIVFDLVVFDEASQIRVPQSIGAIGRAKAVIVIGDSKQMPPTRVMQVEVPDVPADAAAEEVTVADEESILSEAIESGLPQLWLEWHYRSRDESLIAFSNEQYYGGRLVTLPAPVADESTGVHWRRVDGVFDRGRTRTNEVEADAIVAEIAERLHDPATAGDSIGVVCFNIQQRDLILNKLEDSRDLRIQAALTAEPEPRLFVRNLENVQGHETDVVLFSLAFSRDPGTGILPLNFGPLNLSGGERRLNVAVTRARKQVLVFASFDPDDIDLRRSNARGIADLKRYLEFAWSRSQGVRAAEVETETPREPSAEGRRALVGRIAAALRERGLEVDTGIGMSGFKVDLVARRAGSEEWQVAVLTDGPEWADRPTVADRHGSGGLLTALMGWGSVQRVWLPGWLRDPEGAIAHIVAAVDAAEAGASTGAEEADAPSASASVPDSELDAVSDSGPGSDHATADAAAGPGVAPPGLPQIDLAAASPFGAGALPFAATGAPFPGAPAQLASSMPAPPQAFPPAEPAFASAPFAATTARDLTSLPPFVPASTTTVGNQSVLDNMRMARPALELMSADVLATEGPIPLDRLATVLARRFGYSRMGEQRRALLIAELRAFVELHEGFAWPAGSDPAAWDGIRVTVAAEDRDIGEISTQEIANAMTELVRQALSMAEDELLRETLNLFGYVRLTPKATSWLRGGLDRAVAQGRLSRDGGRVRASA